jgi:hypothetical protein
MPIMLIKRVNHGFTFFVLTSLVLTLFLGINGCSCSSPKPAVLSDLNIMPNSVEIGEEVSIQFKIANPGGQDGDDANYTVELYINDKQTEKKEVFISQTNIFPIDEYFKRSENTAGTYSVTIRVINGANTLSGNYKVNMPDFVTPTQIPVTITPTRSPLPTITTVQPTTMPITSSIPTPPPIVTTLTSWIAEAYDPLIDEYYGPALWGLSSDGESVNEVQNCQPAFFYGDFSTFSRSINVHIIPHLAAEPDDDYIGFALGFLPGDTKNHNADFLLVDWKASIAGESLNKDFISSCGTGGIAKAGLAVSLVKGIPNTDEFWQHTDQEAACSPIGEGLFELARGTSLGEQGWEFNREYKITFELNKTSLKIYVDNNLEIDINGNFKDGRLAFFNFSQAEVTYSISQ